MSKTVILRGGKMAIKYGKKKYKRHYILSDSQKSVARFTMVIRLFNTSEAIDLLK